MHVVTEAEWVETLNRPRPEGGYDHALLLAAEESVATYMDTRRLSLTAGGRRSRNGTTRCAQ